MISAIRTRGGPWALLDDLAGFHDDFDRLLEGFGGGFSLGRAAYPALNVWESDEGLVVDAELPGVGPEDVEITVANGELVIAGQRKVETSAGEEQVQRHERPGGTFRKVLTLPIRVQSDGVRATHKNGILRIELPRAAEDKPKRIAVQVA